MRPAAAAAAPPQGVGQGGSPIVAPAAVPGGIQLTEKNILDIMASRECMGGGESRELVGWGVRRGKYALLDLLLGRADMTLPLRRTHPSHAPAAQCLP